jgi:DNA-binding MarR family transcriptional regulator
MDNHDANFSLGSLLNDVSRLIRKKFDQRAKDLHLTRAQYYLLAKLSRHEGINQVGLAELLEVEPISAARLVDRMEAAGWVERRADPADRRARRLFLTPKSRPVIERMRRIASGIYEEALAGLDRAERERLIALLTHARRNLGEPANDTGAAGTMALTGS